MANLNIRLQNDLHCWNVESQQRNGRGRRNRLSKYVGSTSCAYEVGG